MLDWTQIGAAGAAGAGATYAVRKLGVERKLGKAQEEAITVNTLRDVIAELREEVRRMQERLLMAERAIEQLSGKTSLEVLGF